MMTDAVLEQYHGFIEVRLIVGDLEKAKQLLRAGTHVLKVDWAYVPTTVFVPPSIENLLATNDSVVHQFEECYRHLEKQYGDAFPVLGTGYIAIPAIRFVNTIGEARVYFSWGKIIDLWYTTSRLWYTPSVQERGEGWEQGEIGVCSVPRYCSYVPAR